MMVFAAYRTDAWLSYASRDLLGLYTTQELAIKRIEKETEPTETDRWNLINLGQTQCRTVADDYVPDVDENFIIELTEIDVDL